jgi:hypothetical protein
MEAAVVNSENENPSFRKTGPYRNARFDPIPKSMTGMLGEGSTRPGSVQACNPLKYTAKTGNGKCR